MCTLRVTAVNNTLVMPLTAETRAYLAALERELEADIAADDVGGLTFGLIAPGGTLAHTCSFGVTDRTVADPADALPDEHTIYRTGSVSKSFTCFGLMVLVQEGHLSVHGAAPPPSPQVIEPHPPTPALPGPPRH